MPDHVMQIESLRAAYRARHDWDCVPELLRELEVVTGSAAWSAGDFADGVLLYGAGSIGAGALDFFTQQGVEVRGFLDDTAGREGARYRGLGIMPLNWALESHCPIVISVKNWQVPAAKLAKAGRAYQPLAHYVVRTHLERFKTVIEEILEDDRSRRVYLTILKANLLSDDSLYSSIYEGNQYWAIPEFQYLTDAQAVMVDAGAYVGQIMEEFVWHSHGIFKRIHAFEPNPRLHEALQSRAHRLQVEWALPNDAIICVQAGLGQEDANLPFFESGTVNLAGGSFLFSQGKQAAMLSVRTLDGYLAGGPVTYLKADVEGFEIPLLRGAVFSITTYRPKIAMSIYHRLTDMADIPLLLRSIVPGYRMAVRHHTWGQADSVLYCWV